MRWYVDMRNEIRRIPAGGWHYSPSTSHMTSQSTALSDNIIIMKGVVDQADPQTVYYHPADEFVADLIGESNFLGAQTIADEAAHENEPRLAAA